MAAIPQRLPTDSDSDQQLLARGNPDLPGPSEQPTKANTDSQDIPIFCSGGCGEVVGYLPRGRKALKGDTCEHWCPTCRAADLSRKQVAEARETSFASTDELAELRKPSRDLRLLRLIEVATVLIILAGSVLIATGRVAGIYLAAFGTLAWLAIHLALWKLSD